VFSSPTESKLHRLVPSASAAADDVRLASRRGMRGLLAAIGLGLLVWLATGIAVSIVVLS
jgi:hypothetical protein